MVVAGTVPDRRGRLAPTTCLVRTDGNELVCASVAMLFLWNRGHLMPIARRRVRTTAVVSTAVISPLMLVMAACTGAGPQTSGAGIRAPGGSLAAASKGIWHTAREIPGTAALNEGGNAQGVSISCPSAGNCTATGAYYNTAGAQQPFVVSEVNGRWRAATRVPGTAAPGKAT